MINIDKFKYLLEDLELSIVDLVRIEEVGPSWKWDEAKDKVTEARRDLIGYVVMESAVREREVTDDERKADA